MNKTLKIALIIIVPLIIILVVARKQGWLGNEEGTAVELTEAKLSTITESVIASGKIQPEIEVNISPEVSGEIIELPVKEGSEVKKGDLLVRINPDLFMAAVNRTKAAVNTAKAAVSSAEAQFIEAENNFKRSKKLEEDGVISQAEFDAAQRAYDVARLNVESSKYQLESAQASLKEAQDNLARTTIYAPQDGTVSALNSEVGERVVGTAQMAGTEIMRIANLQNMEVLVEVNENDIIRVSPNDTAIIEVDAYLDEEFKGVVSEIANSARLQNQSIDQVTNFEVKVRILPGSYQHLLKKGEKSPFRPGMTASLEILTDKKNNVIAAPIQAVTTRTDTTEKAGSYKAALEKDQDKDEIYEIVFVENNGEAKLVVVKTGIQDDELIEIKTGLKEGDQVITGPYSVVSKTLKKGDKIRVEDKEEESEKEED